jgi:hypothetical protein
MPEKMSPSLQSITLQGKYVISEKDFNVVKQRIQNALAPPKWFSLSEIGESLAMVQHYRDMGLKESIKAFRPGAPMYFSITSVECLVDGNLVEVQCRPAMWHMIANLNRNDFSENMVQEALIECRTFIKQVMSIFKGKEIEPVSVYPIIQRREIRDRLLNLGLKETVNHLDDAEKHIVQNNFPESLTSSRTAFEKMVDWQMKKRGLEQTNNYKNNLERLKARGFVDADTTQLLESYYHCLSSLGVHEKGTPPGFYEAQMGYQITLIVLDYFANKLP